MGTSESCSTTPNATRYNIQTSNWLDKHSSTGVTQPLPVPLGNTYDLGHSHEAFNSQCDANPSGACRMDGAGDVACVGTCPGQPQFRFVANRSGGRLGILDPYLTLATEYGWANYMFQTNQGPSFPAHQFIFGGTSAPTAADDHMGIFASENMMGMLGSNNRAGCIARRRPASNWFIRILKCRLRVVLRTPRFILASTTNDSGYPAVTVLVEILYAKRGFHLDGAECHFPYLRVDWSGRNLSGSGVVKPCGSQTGGCAGRHPQL